MLLYRTLPGHFAFYLLLFQPQTQLLKCSTVCPRSELPSSPGLSSKSIQEPLPQSNMIFSHNLQNPV